ncbi:hypothetical protein CAUPRSCDRAFT_12742, partial [Caulochytrium protostelioides]
AGATPRVATRDAANTAQEIGAYGVPVPTDRGWDESKHGLVPSAEPAWYRYYGCPPPGEDDGDADGGHHGDGDGDGDSGGDTRGAVGQTSHCTRTRTGACQADLPSAAAAAAAAAAMPSPASNFTMWFALARRGQCSFEAKTRWAAKQGAVGVVIGDNQPHSNDLITMYPVDATRPAPPVNITAVFISGADFDVLGELMAATHRGDAEPVLRDVVLFADETDGLLAPFSEFLFVLLVTPALIIIYGTISNAIRQTLRRRRERAPQACVNRIPKYTYRCDGGAGYEAAKAASDAVEGADRSHRPRTAGATDADDM